MVTTGEVVKLLREVNRVWQEIEAPGGADPITVLSARFGLLGGNPQSFEEIEREYEIPRERAREIENELLARLAAAANEGTEVSS